MASVSASLGVTAASVSFALDVTAVLLSVYRDKLIALPGRIKRREGPFRVLSWR